MQTDPPPSSPGDLVLQPEVILQLFSASASTKIKTQNNKYSFFKCVK